ncbi:MAG: YfiT family bacillithiol transferase [Bacteroidota bacterium]
MSTIPEELKYPIGKFEVANTVTDAMLADWILTLEQFPMQLAQLISDLTDQQLDTPYRPEGWTVRQLLVHIGDSHLNCYVRFKWALTEDQPTIKAYDQAGWANLADVEISSATECVDFIAAVHRRWVKLLRALSSDQWDRSFVHPETGKAITLRRNLGLYDWHSRHHFAHIQRLIEREGW